MAAAASAYSGLPALAMFLSWGPPIAGKTFSAEEVWWHYARRLRAGRVAKASKQAACPGLSDALHSGRWQQGHEYCENQPLLILLLLGP